MPFDMNIHFCQMYSNKLKICIIWIKVFLLFLLPRAFNFPPPAHFLSSDEEFPLSRSLMSRISSYHYKQRGSKRLGEIELCLIPFAEALGERI